MNPQRLVVALLLLSALILVAVILVAPSLRPTRVYSGYIEGEPLYLAAPIPGQLTAVDVARGDRVAAGAPLFVIDTRPLQAARQQAQGQIDQAQAAMRSALASSAQSAAAAAAARASADEAAREARRAQGLYAMGDGAISQQATQQAVAVADAARANLRAAELQTERARAEFAVAQGQLVQAEGARASAETSLSQAAPYAPEAARVEDVFFQTGEWAAANQPILALLPDDRVRVRFFVPERDIARYRMGQTVHFACDGCARGLTAKINYVSPRAEFTPPVIYSLQSRDRLVFLVEAMPVDPRRLTPGEPVDVTPLGP